jgi:hypothetical protein
MSTSGATQVARRGKVLLDFEVFTRAVMEFVCCKTQTELRLGYTGCGPILRLRNFAPEM